MPCGVAKFISFIYPVLQSIRDTDNVYPARLTNASQLEGSNVCSVLYVEASPCQTGSRAEEREHILWEKNKGQRGASVAMTGKRQTSTPTHAHQIFFCWLFLSLVAFYILFISSLLQVEYRLGLD
jgi:hypothetical protein